MRAKAVGATFQKMRTFAITDRGNRPAFNRHMAAQGFCLREERLDRVATIEFAAYKGRLLSYRLQ